MNEWVTSDGDKKMCLIYICNYELDYVWYSRIYIGNCQWIRLWYPRICIGDYELDYNIQGSTLEIGNYELDYDIPGICIGNYELDWNLWVGEELHDQ